jgi:hypothetical protein
MLERGDEREPDRLPRDREIGGIGIVGEDASVRNGLDPRRLGDRSGQRDVGVHLLADLHRACAPDAPLEHVETDVRRDPVEPRAKRGAALEAVVAPPRAQERVLNRVLGLERRAEHAVAVAGQLGAVLLELELGGNGDVGHLLTI